MGELRWGLDEGLTGWVARTKTPAFIRENALADPRMKYVPELEEQRFQSMVAVPVLGRGGEVIGVIVLHTQAPREFDDDVVNFLVHTASLVAGAIENAQLYGDAKRRVEALTTLTELSQDLAAVTLREELYETVSRGARALLRADLCQVWRLDREAQEPVLAASDPPEAREAGPDEYRSALMLELMRSERARRRAAGGGGGRTAAGGAARRRRRAARRGLLPDARARLRRRGRRAAARGGQPDRGGPQEGGADRAADRREHRQGHVRGAGRRARSPPPRRRPCEARCDLSRPHVFLHAERAPALSDGPPWPQLAARLESRLRRLYRRAFFDARHDSLRALVPLPAAPDAARGAARPPATTLAREHGLLIGLTAADRGAAGARRRMREAADAARIARSLTAEGGAISYEELGAYRYLVHLELDEAPHDRYGQAVQALIEYDERRNAQLLETLERFLASRSSVTASARALYIHPNTVRQRLDRIEQITGLELRDADLLSLELALKVARLHSVRGAR